MNYVLNENPTARIAVKKNVLKVYTIDQNNIVYLKDGTEFQIELFNPTEAKILCKIKLNEDYISQGGIIINPKERIFLDRHLNSDKKLKFNVYKVNSELDKEKIKNSGNITVEFYNLYLPTIYINEFYFPSITYTPYNTYDIGSASIDVGRIEQGSKSKQEFVQDYNLFEDYYFLVEQIKLVPDTNKVFEYKDIKHKHYCSNCGKKLNKNDNYCSSCGHKI